MGSDPEVSLRDRIYYKKGRRTVMVLIGQDENNRNNGRGFLSQGNVV
jgi:hypothetical protein